jgi:hypothetical protein
VVILALEVFPNLGVDFRALQLGGTTSIWSVEGVDLVKVSIQITYIMTGQIEDI